MGLRYRVPWYALYHIMYGTIWCIYQIKYCTMLCIAPYCIVSCIVLKWFVPYYVWNIFCIVPYYDLYHIMYETYYVLYNTMYCTIWCTKHCMYCTMLCIVPCYVFSILSIVSGWRRCMGCLLLDGHFTSVLQCVAVCCSVLQCVAVCRLISDLQDIRSQMSRHKKTSDPRSDVQQQRPIWNRTMKKVSDDESS